MLRTLSKGNVFDVPFSGATFHCRALSGREFRSLESLGGKVDGAVPTDSASRLFTALRKGIRGWSNVLVDDPQSIEDLKAAGAELYPTSTDGTFAVAYDPDVLDLILDLTDAGELLGLMSGGNRPSGAAVGKSDSPAQSPPA